MTFKKGDRVRVCTYPHERDVIGHFGTVTNQIRTGAYVAVDLDDPPYPFYNPALFQENELELVTISGRDSLTGSEAALLRESGAPNADRIAKLEKRVTILENRLRRAGNSMRGESVDKL